MKDFNTANSQDELIPAGTIARATFKLKGGGNYGEHNLLSKSDNTGGSGRGSRNRNSHRRRRRRSESSSQKV